VHKAEYPTFVQSRYEVLCKHLSQSRRVAQSTNTTHKYSANPLRSCSSKASASFCWNEIASGIGSPYHQLCEQTRSQVHRQQARDPSDITPTHFSTTDSTQSVVLTSSSSFALWLALSPPTKLRRSPFWVAALRSRMYPTPALRHPRPGLFFYDTCLRPTLLRIWERDPAPRTYALAS
jgi:hypothetical protein